MKAFIARQPIFNKNCNIIGYELLYRDSENVSQANIKDGDKATSRLLSDAVNIFGLEKLTNKKPAFVNFTENLLRNDYALLVDQNDMIIEILEDTHIDEDLIEKVKNLKENGYKIALDDYTGDNSFTPILPFIDILKVDFMLTNKVQQQGFPKVLSVFPDLKFLAEKIEDKETFDMAIEAGYTYFQGYYFEKPKTIQRNLPEIPISTFNRLVSLTDTENEIDMVQCADIIKENALLTYRLLQKINTLKYFRGNKINDVHMALVTMGQKEVRRWIYLMMIRDNNVTNSTDVVTKSLIRAMFSKRIVEETKIGLDSEDAFLIGMFSMIDIIMGRGMEELLNEIEIDDNIKNVLLDRQNSSIYGNLLDCVCEYENKDRDKSFSDYGINITEENAWKIYMDCIVKADENLKDD